MSQECSRPDRGGPVAPHSARAHHAAQQPAAGELLVDAHSHLLTQARGVRIGDDEAHVRGDRADIRDVVVDALQFQQDGAHHAFAAAEPRPRRASMAWQNAVPCEKAESPEMLSARNTARWIGISSKQLFGPFVRVEHAQLQVEDRLAGDREIEVSRVR